MKYQTISLFGAKGKIYYVTVATMIFSRVKIYMLFAGWEVRIVKNCDRGLENAARGRIFKAEVTVFHYTDRPKAGK